MHPGYERHAAVLLGYDAKKRAFLFQNAWQGWGLGATQYGWISYETFRHGVYHAFTYADEEFCLR
jgi:C1A family cysteine protease